MNKYNLGQPKTYRECISLLKNFQYIDEPLEKKLLQIVGLRNIPVHEYLAVDFEKLFSFLDLLGDFRNFIKAVKEYI